MSNKRNPIKALLRRLFARALRALRDPKTTKELERLHASAPPVRVSMFITEPAKLTWPPSPPQQPAECAQPNETPAASPPEALPHTEKCDCIMCVVNRHNRAQEEFQRGAMEWNQVAARIPRVRWMPFNDPETRQ